MRSAFGHRASIRGRHSLVPAAAPAHALAVRAILLTRAEYAPLLRLAARQLSLELHEVIQAEPARQLLGELARPFDLDPFVRARITNSDGAAAWTQPVFRK